MFAHRSVDTLCSLNAHEHLKVHLCGEFLKEMLLLKERLLMSMSSQVLIPVIPPRRRLYADTGIVNAIYWHVQGHKHTQRFPFTSCKTIGP